MLPISFPPPVPQRLRDADEETEKPSPNIEPNNIPYQGVYGHVDPNAPTRAEVRADLVKAKAAGLVTYGEQEYPVEQALRPHKTRAQVMAELAEAQARGEYHFGELDYP
ncbi:DUF4148 domain-containing protein [Bordetella sp. 15P40C-2]|uniref:DUF4148 domain-containing protein n=1 Tax=Bordetella sp. 15P40C-2 TaxID=2572246 RepID=UPI001321E11A|nr:DUF4148 domain-containing protein [Bordetella sp. 15P40C-2]MVW73556.1 DUF4148 domain-containing protein [Bordetella sp. 15P40C-2]